MSDYSAKKEWTTRYLNNAMMYPAENLIRIFKGSYPKLNLKKLDFKNKKICDSGFGDGRNIAFFDQLKFNTFGMEISQEIVDTVQSNLKNLNISSDLRVGSNSTIPFDDGFFDFVVAWDSIYYMGDGRNFLQHVMEHARILKPGGYLVMSIPKKNHVYFTNCEQISDNLVKINNDPLNVRNGEVLRQFRDTSDIQDAFSEYFDNFIFGSEDGDLFGLEHHWHRVICQKK